MVSDTKKTPPGSVCRLRPLRAEDRATCLIWRNDPELRGQMMGHRFPVTDEMEMHWLSRAMDDAVEAIKEFAARHPDRWAKATVMLARLAGYHDKVKVDGSLALQVSLMSDVELLDRLAETQVG